jgi:hypothetical protein
MLITANKVCHGKQSEQHTDRSRHDNMRAALLVVPVLQTGASQSGFTTRPFCHANFLTLIGDTAMKTFVHVRCLTASKKIQDAIGDAAHRSGGRFDCVTDKSVVFMFATDGAYTFKSDCRRLGVHVFFVA